MTGRKTNLEKYWWSDSKFRNQLSKKQAAFVKEFLISFDVRLAGEASGDSNPWVTIQSEIVQQALREFMTDRLTKVEISRDRVLIELARLAFSDPRGLFGEDGKVLPPSQWSDRAAASVSSFDVVTNMTTNTMTYKVKLLDKNSAVLTLVKHLGMIAPTNVNVTGQIDHVHSQALDLSKLNFKELAVFRDLVGKCQNKRIPN